jgi:hypothetical protein
MDPKIEEMAKYNDYVANFDPKVYLETYYCKIEEMTNKKKYNSCLLHFIMVD